jgi:molybdate transport system ATP-binding protein
MTAPGHSQIQARFAGQIGGFTLNVDFTAPAHGITALFGPSGCGKTTVLRCIAGLSALPGRLNVAGDVWQDDASGTYRKPHERHVGYVFQEASLFAHLSVRRNLLYGAQRAGAGGDRSRLSFDDTVDLLGLARLLDRAPATLSGGERQRVALGRALLSQPRLLLMDEPLAALDRMTKDEVLPYLETLHHTLATPIIYVSHDIGEVERLADTLVLMENGRVRAAGPLAVLEADPELPLLRAREAAMVLEGRVSDIDTHYQLTSFAVAGGALIVPGRHGSVGSAWRLRISATDISFVRKPPEETTALNCLPVRIVSVAPHSDGDAQVNLVVALGEDGTGDKIVGRITRKSYELLKLDPGTAVYAQIKSVALLASR